MLGFAPTSALPISSATVSLGALVVWQLIETVSETNPSVLVSPALWDLLETVSESFDSEAGLSNRRFFALLFHRGFDEE